MRTLPSGIVAALLVALSCMAQESPQFHACGKQAKTQFEINTCASDEAGRADAELNRVYKQLLAKAGNDSQAVGKIKAAEKAWITYRDAYIEASFPAENKPLEYGSMYSMEVSLLTAKLTRRQTLALREMLK